MVKPKNYVLAVLLSFEGGVLGFDRFYLGKIGTGILKALTLGGCLVWWFIDLCLLFYNKQRDIDNQSLSGQELRNPTLLVHLSAFGGLFGLDRLFLGYTFLGLLKLITLGGFGLWWLIDLYLVLKGKLADTRGRKIQVESERSQGVALMFSFTAGIFGLDRYYLGYRTMAIIKLFSLGGAGIWYCLDIILIVLNTLKDSQGHSLTTD